MGAHKGDELCLGRRGESLLPSQQGKVSVEIFSPRVGGVFVWQVWKAWR
jgi:hypothetical protein